jgi:hypothetical protein
MLGKGETDSNKGGNMRREGESRLKVWLLSAVYGESKQQ